MPLPIRQHRPLAPMPPCYATCTMPSFERPNAPPCSSLPPGFTTHMNYSELIQALHQASAFDLYRMREAINRVLDEPRWLNAIQSRLKVGQDVEYFEPQANALKKGKVLELRRKQAVIFEFGEAKQWLVWYAAINLDGADVRIRENKTQGLGRNEIALDEVVGFLDRDQQQRTGRVIRINDKTVTLQCGQAQWRVAYAYLHRVVDAQELDVDVIELTDIDNYKTLAD